MFNHLKVKDIPKNADGTWPRICHHCFKAGHLRSKCPDLGRKPTAAGGSYYVEVCSQDLGWVGAANLPEEDLPGEEGVSQEEILNFWRGDGGGDAKQESGDFCGWVGEILTPIILLKDRLIGDEGGEEFLEEEKEGVSFSSPEIPRGGNSQVGVKPMNLLQQVRFINFIKRKGIKTQNTNRALIKLS